MNDNVCTHTHTHTHIDIHKNHLLVDLLRELARGREDEGKRAARVAVKLTPRLGLSKENRKLRWRALEKSRIVEGGGTPTVLLSFPHGLVNSRNHKMALHLLGSLDEVGGSLTQHDLSYTALGERRLGTSPMDISDTSGESRCRWGAAGEHRWATRGL